MGLSAPWENVFERGKALKHTTRFPLVAYIVAYSCCQYDRYLALPKIRSSLPLRPINHALQVTMPSKRCCFKIRVDQNSRLKIVANLKGALLRSAPSRLDKEEERVAEIDLAKFGSSEISCAKIGPAEECSTDLNFTEFSSTEVGLVKVGSGQVSSSQVSAFEVSPTKKRIPEDGATQIRTAEQSSTEVSPLTVTSLEVG